MSHRHDPDSAPKKPVESEGVGGKRFSRRQLVWIWTGVVGISTVSTALLAAEEIGNFGVRQYRRVNPKPSPTPTPRPLRQALLHFARVGARNVTPAQMASLSGRSLADYPPERQSWLGLVIDYRVEFQGLDNEVCTVHWSLFDEANVPVSDSFWTTLDAAAWPNEGWDPETTNTDVQEGDAWIPYIAPGTFQVVLVVKDAREQQLAELATEPFEVLMRGG